VNRSIAALLAAADRPRLRFGIALVCALLLWLLFLIRASTLFAPASLPPPAPDALNVRLVEIAPPAQSVAPPVVQPATRAPAAARLQSPRYARPQTHMATSAPRRDATGERPQEAARKDIAANGGEAAEHAVKPAETAASAPATTVSGVTQARLLSQPLPVLPDDLREVAYRAEAVARFAVHPDGTFDIQLVTPTQYPRLNQILLETLRKWRFFPAMDNGRPVESHQDVRIHFNVE